MNIRRKILFALLGVIVSIALLAYLDLRDLSLSQKTESELQQIQDQRRFLQQTWTELGHLLFLANRAGEGDRQANAEFGIQIEEVLAALNRLSEFDRDLKDQEDIFNLRREILFLRRDLNVVAERGASPASSAAAGPSPVDLRIRNIHQLQWSVSRFFNDRFHGMSVSAHRRVQWSYVWLFSALCVSVLCAAGFGFFLNRTMLGPFQRLRVAADRIRAGDLDVSLDTTGMDEFSRVNLAFTEMTQSLKEKFGQEQRLNHELDDINRRLEMEKQDFERLVEISRTASATLDLERVLSILVTKAMQIVRCFRCSSFQIDPDQPDSAVVLSSTLEIREGPLSINLERYPEIRAAARTLTTIQIDDVTTDERMREVANVARQAGITSVLAVPMLNQGRFHGVISFLRDAPNMGYFTEWERRLAETIAGIGATCIENAKLYGEAHRKSETATL